MNLEENWKRIKPQNDYSLIIDFVEHMLRLSKKSINDFSHDLGEEVFSHLAYVTVTYYRSSLKSSVDSVTRSLLRLLSDYSEVELSAELCLFHYILGKTWKKHENLQQSEKSLTAGITIARAASLLHPVHVKLLLNLCKVYNKLHKLKESLSLSKEAANICQDIVVMGKFASNLELARLTCAAYLQVSSQENLLGNLQQSYLWCQKAERILSQNPQISSKFSGKIRNMLQSFANKPPATQEPRISTPRKFTENFRQLASNKVSRHKNSNEMSLTNQKSLPKIESVYSNSSSSRKRIMQKAPKEVANHDPSRISTVTDRLSNQFLFTNIAARPTSVTIACQTDDVVRELTEVRQSMEMILPTKIIDIPEVSGMVLVRSSKISIRLEEYEIKYYLNKEFDKIRVVLFTEKGFITYDANVQQDLTVLDMINKTLHPCIDVEDNQIVLKEDAKSLIGEVTIFRNGSQIYLQIFQRTLRGDVIVRLDHPGKHYEKIFSVFDVMKGIHKNQLTHEYLKLCFDYVEDEILFKPPVGKIELLYARYMKIGNSSKFLLKVSKAQYENHSKYLFHSASIQNLSSLVMNENHLAQYYEVSTIQIELNIEKVVSFMSIKASRLWLEPGKIEVGQEELQLERDKSYIHQEEKTILQPKPTEIENLEKENELAIKLQKNFRGYLVRKTIQADKINLESVTLAGRKLKITYRETMIDKRLRISVTDKIKNYFLTLKTPIEIYSEPWKKTILKNLCFRGKNLYLRIPSELLGYIFHESKEIADQNVEKKEFLGYDNESSATKGENSNIYGRIIYRTCLCKKDIMYQISMSLSKSENEDIDVLHFLVRSGPNSEHTQKFVIDLNTICIKSGFNGNQYEKIGYYVVHNMLTFAGKEVSFLNFDNKTSKAEQNLVKIQAYIRGMLTRKKINSMSKRFVCKFSINSFEKKWVCSLKKDSSFYYLQVKNENDVGRFKLIGRKVDLESPVPSIREFFRNKLIPIMSIVIVNGEVKLRGLEEFMVDS